MIAFITGGTGFIGRKTVKKLLERNYEVIALVRDLDRANSIHMPGVKLIKGNILERETMKAGMKDCDVVFHLAGWYKLGARDQSNVYETNVVGTRNVLELAQELCVPRIIYTSSIGVYGDTNGLFHDENYQRPLGRTFLTEYDRSKWQAHFQVAMPLITKGAPITIVIPGAVYGPADRSLIGQLICAYLRGYLIAFPGPETMHTFAHVDDVAEGHILAYERGQAGQSYIIAGPGYPFWQIARLWSILSGRPAPKLLIPAKFIKPLEPIARFLSTHLPMPELISVDGIRLLGATYIASSKKAETELGWHARTIEVGFKETLDWFQDFLTNSKEQ